MPTNWNNIAAQRLLTSMGGNVFDLGLWPVFLAQFRHSATKINYQQYLSLPLHTHSQGWQQTFEGINTLMVLGGPLSIQVQGCTNY